MHELILTIAFVIVGLVLLIYAILWLLSAYLIVNSTMSMNAIKAVEMNGDVHYWYAKALRWKYGRKYWRKYFEATAVKFKWTEEQKKQCGWRK